MKDSVSYVWGVGLSIAAIAIAQPAAAQGAALVGVELRESESGLEIILEIPGADAPQVLTSSEGETLTIYLLDTQLRLGEGDRFQQLNPAVGIDAIEIDPFGLNSVRVTVVGSRVGADTQVDSSFGSVVLNVPGASLAAPPSPDVPTGTGVDATQAPSEAIDAAPIEVVVTATRTEEATTDVPRAVTVITREQIEESSLLSNDLSTILGELVPGLGPPNPEGRTRNQSLRGRRALILIDGIPQNTNTSFDTELSSIDPSAIERVEVIRGPSATYGDGATGGIINIITRTPADAGFESNAALTLRPDFGNLDEDGFGYKAQYGFSGREGDVDFVLNLAFDSDQAYFDAEGDRIPPDGLSSDNDTIDALAKIGIDLGPSDRLQFSYQVFNNDFESEFTTDSSIFAIPGNQEAEALEIGELDFDDPPEQTVQNFNLTYRHEAFLGSQLDAQVYYRTTDLTQIFTDLRTNPFFADPANFPAAPRAFQTNLDASEFGTRVQLDSPLGDRLGLVWGIDYAREENEAPFNDLDADLLDQNIVSVIGNSTQAPDYSLESLGLFAQLKWDISDRWIFSGGARFEAINGDVDTYTASPFSPAAAAAPPPTIEGGQIETDDVVFNAGLVFKASPDVSLFANFSQGFSIPSLGFTLGSLPPGTDIDSAIALDAQKVDNYELGISGNWRDVQVSLAGFYNESELGSNLVPGDPITEIVRAPQRNYGFEFTVDWQPSDRWSLGSILTWNEGDFDPDDDGDFDALSSVQVQPLQLTLYVENETLPRWRNRLQMFIVGDRDRAFEDEVDLFEIEGYTLVDFISTLDLGSNNRLQFGIDNLLDEQYLPVSSQERIGSNETRRFPGRGRTFSLRYEIDF